MSTTREKYPITQGEVHMSYSHDITNEIKSYLQDKDIKYSFDQEKGRFTIIFDIRSKLQNTTLNVMVHDDYVLAVATCPLSAKDCLPEMAEFTTRVNYAVRNGNFDMDFNDGAISYRCYLNCKDNIPTRDGIEETLALPVAMMSRYGDSIVSVIFGVQSPKEAIEAYN